MHISRYILQKGFVPLNPFMIFEYFMLDTVNRNTIRNANNNLVKKADELWVFGQVSDGVLDEIKLAKKLRKPIKYFSIIDSKKIIAIPKNEVKFEEGLENNKKII
jgi:hypothetical protein